MLTHWLTAPQTWLDLSRINRIQTSTGGSGEPATAGTILSAVFCKTRLLVELLGRSSATTTTTTTTKREARRQGKTDSVKRARVDWRKQAASCQSIPIEFYLYLNLATCGHYWPALKNLSAESGNNIGRASMRGTLCELNRRMRCISVTAAGNSKCCVAARLVRPTTVAV